MELRPYQRAAVESVYCYLREQDGNPVVCIPPAGGKTPILATIASDAVNLWNGRVLVVTHVRELVEQAVDKLRRICPGLPVGVYSAGLKRRDTKEPVITSVALADSTLTEGETTTLQKKAFHRPNTLPSQYQHLEPLPQKWSKVMLDEPTLYIFSSTTHRSQTRRGQSWL